MKRGPVIDRDTGEEVEGDGFSFPGGNGIVLTSCHERCQGVLLGQVSPGGSTAIHLTPSEALEIGRAMVALATRRMT